MKPVQRLFLHMVRDLALCGDIEVVNSCVLEWSKTFGVEVPDDGEDFDTSAIDDTLGGPGGRYSDDFKSTVTLLLADSQPAPHFNFTDEERERAEALAQMFRKAGHECTVDEAQLASNICALFADEVANGPKAHRTKRTLNLGDGTRPDTQAVCLVLAEFVLKMHDLEYADVNVRALSCVQTMVGVLAALEPKKKLKHGSLAKP